MEQFKASGKDWDEIEEGECRYDRTIRELRDRVAALEAAPDRVLVRSQTGEYLRAGTPVYLAAPAKAVPSDEELLEIWKDTKGGAIEHFRALFDHGYAQGLAAGRAEQQAMAKLPTDYDAPQTLHTVALGMVDSLGRSFNLLPEILDTLRRAIREPMAEQQVATEKSSAAQSDPQVLFSVTLAGSSAIRWEDVINALTIAEAKLFDLWEYSKGIDPWCLQVADTAYPAYRAVHDLMNECRRTGATGAIGGLASPPSTTPELEPSPSPAADGGLLWLLGSTGYNETYSREALLIVAKWLRSRGNHGSAADLEREANR